MVHQVENSEDFANQLQQAEDKLVVVDFFATWWVVSLTYPCVKVSKLKINLADFVMCKANKNEQSWKLSNEILYPDRLNNLEMQMIVNF